MSGASVGRIDLDLGINYGQFNREMNGIAGNATGVVGGAFKKLGVIIAGAFAVHSMVAFGRSAIRLASDLNEVQNVVDVTFGSMSSHVDAFAKNALTSFGLSELSAKKFTSVMGAMLKSSGLSGAAMTSMSEALTGLSADFASFYNLNNQDAFDKIRAGISGETEPLRQLGINMTVANLEAYALSQGITKSYNAMTQAEQVLLRYNYLLNASKDAQGDFARTSTSWANQTRLLSEQWKIFQGTMGQGFINILTPVVRGLNILIQKLQIAAQYFKAFTEMIFGAQKTTGSGTTAVTALGTAAESAGGSTGNLGGALGSTGAAAKKAGKDVKGALAGFDNLNTISMSTASALSETAGGLGGIGGGMPTSLPEIKTPKIELPKIDTSFFKNLTKDIDFSKMVASFDNLKKALAPFTETLFKGLQWFWDNILVPFGTWVMEDFIPAWLDNLADTVTFLNGAIVGFQPLAQWLWDNFLKPLAEWTGGVIVSTLNLVGDVLAKIGTWMSNNQGVVTGITLAVIGFFAAWKVIELMAFIQMSGGIVAAFSAMTASLWANTGAKIVNAAETAYLTFLYAVDFVKSIAKGSVALVVNTAKWVASTAAIAANKIAMVAGAIAQGVMTAATVAWNIAAGIGAAVTTAFGVAVAILTSPITLVIAAIAALVIGIVLLVKHWDKVKEAGAKAWTWIKQTWSGAGDWLMSKVINPMANGFKGLINGISKGLNTMIRGLNKIKIEIPDWVPGVGGKKFGVNIPEIPMLAKGGLAKAPTLAMVGDNKNAQVDPEVISPLSKLQDVITRTIAEAFAAMGQNQNSNSQAPTEIILKLGETELGRAVIKAINRVQRQTGVTLLNV